MINIAIIEDDAGIRNYTSEFLNMQPNMACEVLYDNAEDFLANAELHNNIDILLLDINLPKMLGIDAIKLIKTVIPNIEIIMLTVHSSSEMVFQALCAGATGYLLKSTPLGSIAAAIQSNYEGGSAMSPTIARLVISHFNPKVAPRPRNFSTVRPSESAPLTSRELQVLGALAEGLSYKLIAKRLQMSEQTIPVHIRNIYRKLQVNTKAEAIAYYRKHPVDSKVK